MTEALACLLLSIALYGSPGPATLSLISSGVAIGFLRSLGYLTGIVVGVGVTLLFTLSGLFALMASSAAFATTLRYAGFTYILYLGWRIARSATDSGLESDSPYLFRSGVLLSTLNPGAYVAAALIYSQFSDSVPLTWLVTIIVATAIAVNLGWCVAGTMVRQLALPATALRRLNLVFALLLTATATFVLLI